MAGISVFGRQHRQWDSQRMSRNVDLHAVMIAKESHHTWTWMCLLSLMIFCFYPEIKQAYVRSVKGSSYLLFHISLKFVDLNDRFLRALNYLGVCLKYCLRYRNITRQLKPLKTKAWQIVMKNKMYSLIRSNTNKNKT